jgi:S1-C subfamily serine protease
MLALVLLTLAADPFPVVAAPEFPATMQQAALAATVRIQNLSQRTNGSGSIVAVDGPFVYILTAGHVIRGGEQLEVETFTAASYPKTAQVFRTVRIEAESQGVKDMALLRVTAGEKVAQPLQVHPTPAELNRKNFDALTVGCDKGDAPTCQVERVVTAKTVRREGKGEGYCWEVDRAQVQGRSGGPLLDRKGRLIGICSGNSGERSYFCHLRDIETFLNDKGFRGILTAAKQ